MLKYVLSALVLHSLESNIGYYFMEIYFKVVWILIWENIVKCGEGASLKLSRGNAGVGNPFSSSVCAEKNVPVS